MTGRALRDRDERFAKRNEGGETILPVFQCELVMNRFFFRGVRKKKRSNDNDLYECQIMIIDFLPEWRKRRREAKQVLGTARVCTRYVRR